MTEHPALRVEDLFHTGIVVDDLAAARDELGAAMGLSWYEGGAEVRLFGTGAARTVEAEYALSREGPHHLELVQSVPDTLWTVAAPGHAHHLGWWVDDLTLASTALEAFGAARLGAVAMADDAPLMCAYFRMPGGLCVEIVPRGMKKFLIPDAEAKP